MGTNMTTRSLWGKLRSKAYRDAFVDSAIGNAISAQIFALRTKQELSQAELADRCGMKQERISVMENPDYQNFSLKTLKRLAAAFDVALLVRFVPYSELVRWRENETNESLAVATYEEDAAREKQESRIPPYRKGSQESAGRPVSGASHLRIIGRDQSGYGDWQLTGAASEASPAVTVQAAVR